MSNDTQQATEEDCNNFIRSARQLGFSYQCIQEDLYAATRINVGRNDIIIWTIDIKPTYSTNLASSSQRWVLYAKRFNVPEAQLQGLIEKYGFRPLLQSQIEALLDEKQMLKAALNNLWVMERGSEEKEVEVIDYLRRAQAIGYTYLELKRHMDYCDYELSQEKYLSVMGLYLPRPVSTLAHNFGLEVYIWLEKHMQDYVQHAAKIGLPLTTILHRLLVLGYDEHIVSWADLNKCIRQFRSQNLLPHKFELGDTAGFTSAVGGAISPPDTCLF